jgi:phosphoglucomutase
MAGQVSPRAGKTIEPSMLVNVPRLVTAYFVGTPDPTVPSQCVAFGTSGHRGSALDNAFNEAHILAISQAICHHRSRSGITGPLFVGIDTHALSEPARTSALEVFAANEVDAMIDERGGYTPTPVISHAILTYNKNRKSGGQASPDHAIRGFATPAGNTQIRNGQPSRFRVSTCSLVSCSKYWSKASPIGKWM